MCVSDQLQLEFDAAQRWWNRRVMEEVKKKKLTNYHYASAFDLVPWPIITAQQPDLVQVMHWGYLPSGKAGDVDFARKTYNARSEEVFEKPTYSQAAEEGWRCLIPVTGFFEHQDYKDKKYPHRIFLKNRQPFYLGGLYNPHTKTYTILTTRSGPLMSRIHNKALRQPVIIYAHEDQWLSPTLTRAEFEGFCEPMPDIFLDHYTVSKLLTARGVDRNVPEVAAPFDYPELAHMWPPWTTGPEGPPAALQETLF